MFYIKVLVSYHKIKNHFYPFICPQKRFVFSKILFYICGRKVHKYESETFTILAGREYNPNAAGRYSVGRKGQCVQQFGR